ncbi:lycopene cyclase domain-containing protein [Sanguibacter sp. HDW7]|uniref:lycopene cyclase domain-containing protein n=1 Tax=Sanguibacter sp. HDW7 TaxID=2714931 RepID=UPI0014073D07|nr:lycopene cyclase domain-containing protein [Sanguibacter sp. HDW7]QIK84233.1 lycopene cyclase domain-containing protein [Sanguibacter sp. HDW7]
MTGAYLAALLVSGAGVLAIDLRWRLLLGARSEAVGPLGSGLRVVAVVVLGALLLLAWDVVAIRAGFYGRGGGDALLGVEVAPHLPLEELVFVVFLPYVTLVVAAACLRVQERRRRRDR